MEEASLPRRRKTPKRFECGDGEAYHSSTVEEHYRRQYFEVLDLAVCSITTHFDQPGYTIYTKLENLLLKAAHRDDFSHEIEEVTSVYKDDIDVSELSTQLEIFGTRAKSHNPRSHQVSAEPLCQSVSPPWTGVPSRSPASRHASDECH